MIFAEPWLLLAFLVLPLLWWLLRASPPAPRMQSFPALRLLADLSETSESPERTPPWLMALRILALACLILGLANPVLNPQRPMAGGGPLLIVLDNGWAAAGDWADRTATARGDPGGRAGRSPRGTADDRGRGRWPPARHCRADDGP
jgi:hypothetical protein